MVVLINLFFNKNIGTSNNTKTQKANRINWITYTPWAAIVKSLACTFAVCVCVCVLNLFMWIYLESSTILQIIVSPNRTWIFSMWTHSFCSLGPPGCRWLLFLLSFQSFLCQDWPCLYSSYLLVQPSREECGQRWGGTGVTVCITHSSLKGCCFLSFDLLL